MRQFFLMLLAAAIGTVVAYAKIRSEYGNTPGTMGDFAFRGEVTATNVMELREQDLPDQLPVAATPDGDTHDFGIMKVGEKGEHAFRIRNDGEVPLTLELGASTCKCTLGTLESDSLQPGEETEVKLEWTVSTNKDAFQQSAEIRTNDPTRVGLRLKIFGKVVSTLRMEPSTITLGDVAAGEEIVGEAEVYSYLDEDILAAQPRFGEDELNDLSELTVEPIDPADSEEHSRARQGFRIRYKIGAGLKQGNIRDTLVFRYADADEVDASVEEPQLVAESVSDSDIKQIVDWQIVGKVVGVLSMIPNPKLGGSVQGNWMYTFGRLQAQDELIGKALVTLKGKLRESTTLSIGEVYPEGTLKATLEDPIGQGSMSLYRLNLELVPGDEPMMMMGEGGDDLGHVMIESDNPEVPPMRILVKFAMDSAVEREAALKRIDQQRQNGQ